MPENTAVNQHDTAVGAEQVHIQVTNGVKEEANTGKICCTIDKFIIEA